MERVKQLVTFGKDWLSTSLVQLGVKTELGTDASSALRSRNATYMGCGSFSNERLLNRVLEAKGRQATTDLDRYTASYTARINREVASVMQDFLRKGSSLEAKVWRLLQGPRCDRLEALRMLRDSAKEQQEKNIQ